MVWPVVAAVASAYGAKQANKKTARYNTYMSNTAHQRQVADLRAAGLNPILSAKLGGASTPTMQYQNVAAAGMQGYAQMSSAKQAQAQTKQLGAQTGLTKAQTEKVRQEVYRKMPMEIRKISAEANLAEQNLSNAQATEIGIKITNKLLAGDEAATKALKMSRLEVQNGANIIAKKIGQWMIDTGGRIMDAFNTIMEGY